jgi:glucokinase
VKKKSIPIGRPSVLRHTNAQSILKLLRECGSCSRADLVRASGLSAPTVTNVVKDLLSENLVEPLGEGESSGGRPPDMIRFKAERGCLLAVEISAENMSFLLTDLNGSELGTHSFSLSKHKTTPEAICGYIGDELKVLLRKQKKSKEQLLAVVVGVPAITNVEAGSVLSISTLEGWRSVPLRAMLSKVVNCLVIVENDMNLAAQGEQYCGAAQSERDFVLINIGTNVGSGIVLGGKIHHGSQWSAGEIAYLRLPSISRRQPTIHEFGELETVLTSSGILRSWHERNGKAKQADKKVDAVSILSMAKIGDLGAVKIIRQRAEIIADIVVNLSLILNPGLILLGGEIGGHPVLIDFVRQQLEGSEFAVTKIVAGTPGNRAVLWGAISLALEALPAVLLPHPEMGAQ